LTIPSHPIVTIIELSRKDRCRRQTGCDWSLLFLYRLRWGVSFRWRFAGRCRLQFRFIARGLFEWFT
jgi:hypothetical protein